MGRLYPNPAQIEGTAADLARAAEGLLRRGGDRLELMPERLDAFDGIDPRRRYVANSRGASRPIQCSQRISELQSLCSRPFVRFLSSLSYRSAREVDHCLQPLQALGRSRRESRGQLPPAVTFPVRLPVVLGRADVAVVASFHDLFFASMASSASMSARSCGLPALRFIAMRSCMDAMRTSVCSRWTISALAHSSSKSIGGSTNRST